MNRSLLPFQLRCRYVEEKAEGGVKGPSPPPFHCAAVRPALALLLHLTLVFCAGKAFAEGSRYPDPSSSTGQLTKIVKFSGCTFDGLISTVDSGIETGKETASDHLALFDSYVRFMKKSGCSYINRAIETWDSPPNFPAIEKNMKLLKALSNRHYVFGAFLAENVSLVKSYNDFDFSAMCKSPPPPGATNCYASFERPEYARYIAYIVRKSIDLGTQVFLFGGASITDHQGTSRTSALLKSVIWPMKSYAANKKLPTLFIVQNPSSFGGSAYLNSFDLIQGGVYINADGTIPDRASVTNKGPGSNAPDRLWLSKDKEGKPYFDPKKLVEEYDFFSSPNDDSSEIACLSVKSQAYLDHLHAQSARNCPLGHLVGSAVPATRKIYDSLRRIGVGFWLPGRQPIGFAPWIYTPMKIDLYQNNLPAYRVNFDDESMLSICGQD